MKHYMSRLKNLRSKKKKLGLVISISLILIGVIPHIILTYISDSNHSYTVEPLSLESEDGTFISAFKYTPKGEKSHGGIVVSHGFTGNKFLMHPLSKELVKRGFTVVSIDFRAHGASGGHLSNSGYLNDVTAAVDYLEYNLPYITEVGLIGYSLGGDMVSTFARIYPNRINATVTVGYIPSNMINISNLLMAIGALESSGYIKEVVLNALMLYTGSKNVEIDELYGDFNAGNAVKGIISPNSGHLFEMMDPYIIYQIIQWFEQSFSGGVSSNIFITTPLFQIFTGISFFGVVALIFVLITYISNYLFKSKLIFPEKRLLEDVGNISIGSLIRDYALYISLIGLIILLFILDRFPDNIILSTANLILILAFGTAIGTIIISFCLISHWKKKFSIKDIPLKIKKMISTDSGRSMLFGIFASVLLISAFATTWHWNVQNILPNASEIGIMIGIIFIICPFFLVKEFYFRLVQGCLKTSNRLKEYFSMVFIGIFMDNLLIGQFKFIGWINLVYLPESFHYLLGLIIFSIVQQFTTTWVYMWSGRNILGSTVFLSIFYAWMSIIFLPSLGFL